MTYVVDPVDELRAIALIGVAATFKCQHCEVEAWVLWDENMQPFVDIAHQRGCPEHEDFLPAAEYGG
ncbi:MAG: hypothetical protein QM621_09010 [Aeromicrobium sp.]|uniref:hypothetical protein n=1 Tax=Aeromicrobium sp. TaxID=1871063 RepID=UPI0039E4FD92